VIDQAAAAAAAGAIAAAALGADPGPLRPVGSRSHQVFVGAAVVVKLIEAADHSRLDREVALAVDLPVGLTAPVLASGRHQTGAGEVRYVCLARLPGAAPGMGLPGVGRTTAVRWARQAVRQLRRLHAWTPGAAAAETLREQLDHGGFAGRSQLLATIDRVRDLDGGVPRQLLDRLAEIADGAPERVSVDVPVHADCHWDNWLVHDQDVTALLDFEWARFGEPADDWMFVARFSGPYLQDVLGVIAEETATPLDELRAACEIREISHLAADLGIALRSSYGRPAAVILGELAELVSDRSWWYPAPG